MKIVPVYEREHNLQTNFLDVVSFDTDMNSMRDTGFISSIWGEATKIFNGTLMSPKLFFLTSLLSTLLGFLSKRI